jgi:predicted DNA-binding protein YlxM (UPF0122 family)
MYPKNMISIVANFYNNNDYSIREIADIFNISKSTIHRWLNSDNIIHTHKKHNDIIDIKLDIKKLLTQNPFITAK